MGQDTITDFTQGQDKIDVSAMNYLGGSHDEAYSFIGQAEFSQSGAPELRYAFVGDNTVVQFDSASAFSQPDGKVDGEITLAGHINPAVSDFIL